MSKKKKKKEKKILVTGDAFYITVNTDRCIIGGSSIVENKSNKGADKK